ncbi:MAG: hypothetical protein IKJ33_02205 [Clostridia bacterium]|nr:hypothetical protein [Clostridia bacterium]
MNEIDKFEICSKYRREDFDFDEIQRQRNNPINEKGYPTYPKKVPSSQGSSFTYQVSDDWFFKRKLQDGGHPHTILSQHHFNQAYNELYGTFDDLGEVIAYTLSKNIIDPKTNKPIVDVPEYRLASYKDQEGVLFRGCISKNVCDNKSKTLVSMAEILRFCGINTTVNSIDVYMSSIEKFTKSKNCEIDLDQIRQTLIKNSFYNWKISNSDNHKNNIMFIIDRQAGGKVKFDVSPLIDNGSAYELSVRYMNDADECRLEPMYKDIELSKRDENGNVVLDFTYYPYMHTAFQLEPKKLLIEDTKINGKNYAYEYALASEMLEDKELYRQVAEIEKQFDLDTAIKTIDETYGSGLKDTPKTINWPPHLKEFMYATNDFKSKTLSFVVADYYLKVAFESSIGKADRENPSNAYLAFCREMINLPLQESKEAYDEIFLQLAQKYGFDVDKSKLENLQFKKEEQPESEKEPNE